MKDYIRVLKYAKKALAIMTMEPDSKWNIQESLIYINDIATALKELMRFSESMQIYRFID